MKIVFLDGELFKDMDMTELNALGDVEIHLDTPDELLVERCIDADIILNNTTPMNRELLEQLQVKLIALTSTGYDRIDIEACDELGITVANVSAYGENSVAQHTMAHIINLFSGFYEQVASVKRGEWQNAKTFTFWEGNPMEMKGKVLGVIGYGAIGKSVARAAEAMGMTIMPYDLRGRLGYSLEEVLKNSDVISIHAPLIDSTKKLINKETIGLMKETAFIVNTARGGIIDEADLVEALNSGRIAGCGLDAIVNEPPSADDPLLSAKNAYITSHTAWVAKESRERIIRTTVANIKAFLSGESLNVIEL